MRTRRTGIALLIAAAIFVVLGLGLAFTIYGEISLLLAVTAFVAGLVLMNRGHRR